MASIAILGCGNIGFYIAAHLIHNNHHAFDNPYNNNKIICIGRQRLLDELNLSKKLTLTKSRKENNEHLKGKDSETDESEMYKDEIIILKQEIIYETDLKKLIEFNPDYVIVTLKSTQTYDVFKELKDLSDRTTIVLIQDGLHNDEIIKQLLPNITIIRGLINNITIMNEPDSSCNFIQYSSSSGSIILESTPGTLYLQKILQQSELPCTISTDIKNLMYSKLLINLNTPLLALSGLPYTEYLQVNPFRNIYKKCVTEGLNVYKLKGITISMKDNLLMENWTKYLSYLPEWVIKLVLDYLLVLKKRNVNSSIVSDFKFARKSEIELLQGEIVKLSEGTQENVKYNRGILSLIKMIEDRMQGTKEGWAEKISDKEVLKYIETGEIPEALHIEEDL